MTLSTDNEQDRILIWGDIRHLYNNCGCEVAWDSEERNADPAWRELQRLIRIAHSHNWEMTDL
jgi:hypothetical protein